MTERFFLKSDVIFGRNAIENLTDILEELSARKIMIVCDQGLLSAGIVQRVLDTIDMEQFEVCVFSEVIPNPTNEVVELGYRIAKEEGVDTFVAVGGGSPIDTAKAIDLLLSCGGSIMDYEGFGRVPRDLKALIAIPTTAGTSSEITNVAALMDTVSVRKYIVIDNRLVPDRVICDPEFMRTVPDFVTAATGMDAITHAIESYISNASNLLTKYHSLRALQLFHQNLPRAYTKADDMCAKENMMIGCLIAGFGFSNANLGLVHAIAHTLSAHFGLAHGDANAAVLPYVVAFNAENCPEEMIEMARALEIPLSGDVEKDKYALASELHRMGEVLCIKPLRDQGRERRIQESDFEILAEEVLKEEPMHFNPRQDVTVDDIVEILRKAY